jgi:hypothetical protein
MRKLRRLAVLGAGACVLAFALSASSCAPPAAVTASPANPPATVGVDSSMSWYMADTSWTGRPLVNGSSTTLCLYINVWTPMPAGARLYADLVFQRSWTEGPDQHLGTYTFPADASGWHRACWSRLPVNREFHFEWKVDAAAEKPTTIARADVKMTGVRYK